MRKIANVCAQNLTTICFFLLAVSLFPATQAFAQPIGVTHWTLEARIATADRVVLGSIEKVFEHETAKPDQRNNPSGKYDYVLTLKVDSVIKGESDSKIEELHKRYAFNGVDSRYQSWLKNKTAGLWFIGPPMKARQTEWTFVPFANDGRAVGAVPPMFANDLSVLDTRDKIIKRAREYGPISKMEHGSGHPRTLKIRIPYILVTTSGIQGGSWNDLHVAIDSELEGTARRMVKSPDDLIPQEAVEVGQTTHYWLRLGGVDMLRYFKNQTNIKLLQAQLDNRQWPFEADDNHYPIRTRVYEVLLHWRVKQPLPKFADKITKLNLENSDIDDGSLVEVGKLSNLRKLKLRGTKITHAGIDHLSGLKNLDEMELDYQSFSDVMLKTLRRNGMLHFISEARTKKDATTRPRNIEEVDSVTFWEAPLTDKGLADVAAFKNVTWIDLRNTAITDAGLAHLAKLSKLTRVLLHETQVTKAGVDKLQKLLPDCRIDWITEK